MLIFDCTDGSGIRMYYMSQLRSFNQGIVTLGQTDLTIPALVRDTTVTGTEMSQRMHRKTATLSQYHECLSTYALPR